MIFYLLQASSCLSPKCVMKLTLLLIMVAAVIAGTALLIHFFKDKSQKGKFIKAVGYFSNINHFFVL